jgi:hypothetical protein
MGMLAYESRFARGWAHSGNLHFRILTTRPKLASLNFQISSRVAGESFTQDGRDARAEQFDGAQKFRLRQFGDVHLESDA